MTTHSPAPRRAVYAIAALLLATTATACAPDGVQNRISERSDLTTFDDLMARTGVESTLGNGRYYTVFAPTNSAFAQLTPEEFPCIYNGSCPNETAELLRNHVVAGEVNPADTTRDVKSGNDSKNVYTINRRLLHITQPNKGQLYVEGKKVLSTRMTSNGTVYIIDGVIANEQELSVVRAPIVVAPAAYNTRERTTVRESNQVSPEGDSRSYQKTITTTTGTRPVYGY